MLPSPNHGRKNAWNQALEKWAVSWARELGRSSLGSSSESPTPLAGHRLLDREAELGHHGGQTHGDLLHLPVLLAESCESNRHFGVSWRVRESNPLAIKVFRPGFERQVKGVRSG